MFEKVCSIINYLFMNYSIVSIICWLVYEQSQLQKIHRKSFGGTKM